MSERFQRLEEIFHQVSTLPPQERESALAELCDGDPLLADQVRVLLQADEEAGAFLEAPVAEPVEPPSLFSRRLGAYRVEEKIGQGGMGVVYRAVRADGTYEQSVALKVFGAGADRGDLMARFRTERQILASLEHPGIARLLDGGTTEDGRPYLVMELVDGVPIDRYCDRSLLSVDERIALFLRVCAAVAYAHQHLVVHRDLKPSNILVTPAGEPRLLDFGIAKLLAGADAIVDPAETRTGQRLLTPQYASPEQLAGGVATTGSDVYSLGVLLYVLLCGRLPYRFDASRPGFLEQAIHEREPERPSVAGLTEEVARVRGVSRRQLARRLAGDLDNIVLLALAKEERRRYASVELLAQDLAHFRAGLPVAARPATLSYRLGKFVRRYRREVALGTAALLAIVALAVVMTVQAYQSARQRDAMERERDKAVRVSRVLEGMFEITTNPSRTRGEAITAQEILDNGVRDVETELADQPEVQASLSLTLGALYGKLGMYDRALPLLERSLALHRRVLGETRPEVADSLNSVGAARYALGDFAGAERAFRQAVTIGRRLGAAGRRQLADSLNGLGAISYEHARYADAEAAFREALALLRQQTNPDRERIAETAGNLGSLRQAQGDYTEAAALHRESLALLETVHGKAIGQAREFHITELSNLGLVLYLQGDFAGAESTCRQALAEGRHLYSGAHPAIALVLGNLTKALTARGDFAAAEPIAREALDMHRALFGEDNPLVARDLANSGTIREGTGDLQGARALYEQALRLQRRVLGEEHPRTAEMLFALASLLFAQGDRSAAEPLAQRVLAIRRKVLPPDHPDLGDALILLGSLRVAAGAPLAGEPLLRQGRAQLLKSLPAGHWRLGRADSELGACLAALGRDREAEPLLVSGGDLLLRRGSGALPAVRETARQRLISFYERRGDPARAASYRSRRPV